MIGTDTYFVAMVAWQPQCYNNNSFVLSPIEVIFGMKLSKDDRHQTYLVAMVSRLPWQPQCYVNNSFVLSPIEVIFGINLSSDDRHQTHTSLLW